MSLAEGLAQQLDSYIQSNLHQTIEKPLCYEISSNDIRNLLVLHMHIHLAVRA